MDKYYNILKCIRNFDKAGNFIYGACIINAKEAFMTKLLFAIFCFCSLAIGQESGDDEFLWVPPDHVRLLPENYFSTPSREQTLKLLYPAPQSYSFNSTKLAGSETGSRADAHDPRLFEYLPPEAAALQLEVIKNNLRPIDGSLPRQIRHIATEAVTNCGASNTAALYYKEYGYTPSPTDPKAMRSYEREHDWLMALYSPCLASFKRSFKAQWQHDLKDFLVKKKH